MVANTGSVSSGSRRAIAGDAPDDRDRLRIEVTKSARFGARRTGARQPAPRLVHELVQPSAGAPAVRKVVASEAMARPLCFGLSLAPLAQSPHQFVHPRGPRSRGAIAEAGREVRRQDGMTPRAMASAIGVWEFRSPCHRRSRPKKSRLSR